MIVRSVSLFDPIKKRNIQTFNITDDKVKKKKTKVNQESRELKNQSKLIKIAEDCPVIRVNDLEKYQLTDHNALTTTSNEKKVIPNMTCQKSKVVSDYLSKVCPEAFCAEKPTDVGFIIVEGENVIASSPGIGIDIMGIKRTISVSRD